jgi:hypothetical protein
MVPCPAGLQRPSTHETSVHQTAIPPVVALSGSPIAGTIRPRILIAPPPASRARPPSGGRAAVARRPRNRLPGNTDMLAFEIAIVVALTFLTASR